MQHYFDVNIAEAYGILEAILLNNLEYWIAKNRANDVNFYDGFYWTYNSTRAFNELFPYVSQRQIQNALKHLRDEGILQTGNYNKVPYDRTLWYAFTKKGECIMQKCQMVDADLSNGNSEIVTPIPDNKPDIKPDKKTNKRFAPPTVDEVREYCQERNNSVDPEQFVDFYASKGWKVGNTAMKDWKACVRTWEKRDKRSRVGVNGVKIADTKDDDTWFPSITTSNV